MIDQQVIHQVKGVLANLSTPFTFVVERNPNDAKAADNSQFVEDVASCSPLLSVEYRDGNDFRFSVLHNGEPTGISFRGIPNGHEFTSLLLVLLNGDGQGRNLPDAALTQRIKALKGDIRLRTYVSLTCTNCPDVVQALNVMALLNPAISHETIDGAVCQDEVEQLNIQAVPAVYLGDELLHVGRGTLGGLLEELEDHLGVEAVSGGHSETHSADLLVLGGGPAGAAAAIYAARKGQRVALVAQRIGGQVNDTTGIENIISVPMTTGAQLASDLSTHLSKYPIGVYTNRRITAVDFTGPTKRVETRGGEAFTAPQVIIATGAGWRRLGLAEEEKYIGHGIHFCPHCDGPFYKGKDVAVIGGGNSGIEAAIDLAGICRHVTVFEFADKLKADGVLQQKLRGLPNVDIFLNSQTVGLKGDGTRLTGIEVRDLHSEEQRHVTLDGVFLQIGLKPNSEVFKGAVEQTPHGEIVVDDRNRTSAKGVYAAGDVTTTPFKQIMIAMGEGAKAALAAFEDRLYQSS
ncbi:MAG: alkyl hydroperoxide reductase subunit F [Prevotella sp.]|nr:alkyl hydroperoxide reductase subunit F [Prevotella sp.]